MASLHGKIEALITIPTGGWSLEYQLASHGAHTISLAAGDTYYHSSLGSESNDLQADLQAKINTAISGESHTAVVGITTDGRYSFACDAAQTVTWTSTGLRDLLGYTAGFAASVLEYGTEQAEALWYPGCPVEAPHGHLEAGWDEYDMSATQSPTGAVVITAYNKRTANALQWSAVTQAKTRTASEVLNNSSWQTFFDDAIYGSAVWCGSSRAIRYYPDETVDGTYVTYKMVAPLARQSPARTVETWTGLYRIAIERLVKVP